MPKPRTDTILSESQSEIDDMSEPLWKGPQEDGITYSLLCLFLTCRERFRVKVVDGFEIDSGFNAPLEYGSMWHLCEEYLAAGKDWEIPLWEYARSLMDKYRFQQDQVQRWHNVCKIQFPIYVEFWEKHKDVKERHQLLQEHSFSVRRNLPSGRHVTLRGKWDSVDLIGKGKNAGIFLQENKSKGSIDKEMILDALKSGFDLQTMIYMTALRDELAMTGTLPGVDKKRLKGTALSGLRYNVIRRPLSGGLGSIVQGKGTKGKKCNLKCCKIKPSPNCRRCQGTGRYDIEPPESDSAFYKRLHDKIIELQDEFFFRWKVEIDEDDIDTFTSQCLDPVLEQLCDWWDWVNYCLEESKSPFDPEGDGIHWRHPYGVFNVMDHGRNADIDRYLNTKNSTGLVRCKSLFPEL